jgi:tRNA nucleotidyltransferase/poly(A) polymerase
MRKDGIIFDFHNGIEHLQRGEIRFIGDAATRIREDYTRIKRYYDFSKRLGIRNYEIEQTIDYIMKNSTEPIIMR